MHSQPFIEHERAPPTAGTLGETHDPLVALSKVPVLGTVRRRVLRLMRDLR